VEPENGITTADVPNLEASIPVNVTVGTLVSASHSQLCAHSSPNILFPHWSIRLSLWNNVTLVTVAAFVFVCVFVCVF
jgi:hypothetical protein